MVTSTSTPHQVTDSSVPILTLPLALTPPPAPAQVPAPRAVAHGVGDDGGGDGRCQAAARPHHPQPRRVRRERPGRKRRRHRTRHRTPPPRSGPSGRATSLPPSPASVRGGATPSRVREAAAAARRRDMYKKWGPLPRRSRLLQSADSRLVLPSPRA